MFDVVMPLYNKEQFVTAAVESVLRQTFPDWRLHVIDDGSVDRGPEEVARFQDPRITLVRQSNQGVGPARNAGIDAGSADWIAFLDSDDVWSPNHLAELDRLRRTFSDAVLIGCGFSELGGHPPRSTGQARRTRARPARYFAECARGRQLFFTSSAAVRRSALDEVGLFEPLPGNEDVELWARLALHGPVAVSSKRTVQYRVGTGGITDREAQSTKTDFQALRREDMSSTIPTITKRLPAIVDPKLRGDLHAYMDSRIGVALVAAVRAGNIAYARHILSLLEGRPRGKAQLAALIAKLPEPIGKRVSALSMKLKAMVSRG